MDNNEPEWFQQVLDRTEQTESFLTKQTETMSEEQRDLYLKANATLSLLFESIQPEADGNLERISMLEKICDVQGELLKKLYP